MPDLTLIPKDYKEKVGAKTVFSKIGILMVVLLVLSLLVYGGLFVLKKPLEDQLADLQTQIEELDEQKDDEFETRVISLEKALRSLNVILKNHFYWSDFVSKFESLVVPQITFSSFEGVSPGGGSVGLILGGRAPGYTYLAKQMVSFSQDDLVSNVEVSDIKLSTKGGIEFTLNINFKKDILLKKI